MFRYTKSNALTFFAPPGIALQSLQIFSLLLRAEIATIFEPKVVTISARNTIMREICKLCKAIFSADYNFFQPNFGILLLLKGCFRELRFFRLDLSRSKISL